MCSIMGYCGAGLPLARFQEGFDRTKSRGPDDTRVIDTGKGWLGFHRLAIMGLQPEGMQPFALGGDYLVCNGEIYGFRKIRAGLEKKGYSFASQSDCEILLPLYREYGTEMFRMLDAEFALILYDGKTGKYLAARDPIGIRPLFYGRAEDGGMLFASEAKNLVGLCGKIHPFPPGCYFDGEKFVCYRDMGKVENACRDSLDEICRNIREKLTAGIEKRLDSDVPLGFLLSGGLDSSLVCSVSARLLGKPIDTFAVGMDTDAIDLKYARQAADYLGCRHHEVIITREDVLEALPTVVQALGTYDITTIRASIGMYLVCRAIHRDTDIRVLLTGEVSDELFGYKYTDFAPSAQAFQEESQKRVRELYLYDVLRADRCISVNSLEARVPFGDLDFVEYVMSIDPEKKRNVYGKGKYLLRRAFQGDYLPESILMREKAAFSDAVGHSMVDDLKAYAEERYTDAEFEAGRRRYEHARPFTKESLLYRELFESFYPGQAEMIPGFWMPNPDWEGCRVSDPSARVLANYGDSGK
ncbi:MAG TPA: asparagine synthase B [Candidatus Merdivicinus excrementipullorum]|uniref:asparagine synthase (glutamine-hydrolyzing) n=1 Tax=Candidatus Merdivicinus excrementipullorum TaxID=2840867 RepID=A0A9D1JYY1_9FIRM|nr:asparagine synthase B [Candidatus Merdivicinus excrementipullorum]